MKLENRVALITGASRGIGRVLAYGFAREGADVVLAARTQGELERTAKEIRENGGRVVAIQTDVSSPASVGKLVKGMLAEFGRVDILINNAGRQPPIGPLTHCDMEDWTRTIIVNLVGTVLCCKAILSSMIERRSGKIINLSGGGATAPRRNFSAYAASKAAVIRFTETLAARSKEV